MRENIGVSLRLFVCLVAITGFLYPLGMTVCLQTLFPRLAEGSLVQREQVIIGSSLLGQNIKGEAYFWPRPSAGDYATVPALASQLGPTSQQLKSQVEERRQRLIARHSSHGPVPLDLLFASGSGLDPHISLEAAYFQLERVASARGWPSVEKEKVRAWIASEGSYVNVLLLNLHLDAIDRS